MLPWWDKVRCCHLLTLFQERPHNKLQESEHERWSRLDKRIERARARHELAHLVMGPFF